MTTASRTHRTTLKYTLARASEERKVIIHREIILRNGQTFLMCKFIYIWGDLNTIKKLAKRTTTDYIIK